MNRRDGEGEGLAMFWEIMGFFGPRAVDIGLRMELRRLITDGDVPGAYLLAIQHDRAFGGRQEEAPSVDDRITRDLAVRARATAMAAPIVARTAHPSSGPCRPAAWRSDAEGGR